MAVPFPHGLAREAADDLQAALRSSPEILARWPKPARLGRNAFICWVEDARPPVTRRRRIARTGEALVEGKKRPCCWAGCVHRTDKAPGRWQPAALIDHEKDKAR